MTQPWDGYSTSTTSPDGQKLRDLDETRRLLYTALYADAAGRRAELVGTIVNALAHHGAGIDPDESAPRVLAVVMDRAEVDGKDRAAGLRWIHEQIDKITDLLA
jgi:hypothetical protein